MPEYSVPFFAQLGERLASDGLELHVFHSPAIRQAERRGDVVIEPWAVPVPAREVRLGGRALLMRRLPAMARKADLLILEQALGKLEIAHVARRHPSPVAMLGHGHIHSRRTIGLEDRLLRRATSKCDWFFGYTATAVKDAVEAGVPEERTTNFRNSTDTTKLSTLRREVVDADVELWRREIGVLPDAPILLFLGSMDASKRPSFLVEAMSSIWAKCPNARLVLVGEGDARDEILAADERVLHAGRLGGRPLAIAGAAASCLVMPGRVGLVATDSFALELPIVTTSWRFHSPEFEYLVNGENAIVARDEPNDFADRVVELLEQPDRLDRLRHGCRRSALDYSTEQMVRLFADGVVAAVEAGPRRPLRRRQDSWRTTPRAAAKSVVGAVGPLRRLAFTSTDYRVAPYEGWPAARGWSNRLAVLRQERAWGAVTDAALEGNPREDIRALWSAADGIVPGGRTLEVGSGHGYLRELLLARRPDLRYVGLDISHAMCRRARRSHPDLAVLVGDAACLPIRSGFVDTVIDAATVMHVPSWRTVIAEEARVSARQLILHSVTVADSDAAIEMTKYAYGARVFEAVLSARQLEVELGRVGFDVVERLPSIEYDLRDRIGTATRSETWICTRRAT